MIHQVQLVSCDETTTAYVSLSAEEASVLERVARVLDKNRGESDCYPLMRVKEVSDVPEDYLRCAEGGGILRDG